MDALSGKREGRRPSPVMMIGHPSSPGLSLLLPCMHSILGLMSASATNNSAPVWPKQGSAQTATPHRVVKVTLQRHSNRKCVCVCFTLLSHLTETHTFLHWGLLLDLPKHKHRAAAQLGLCDKAVGSESVLHSLVYCGGVQKHRMSF